MNHYLDSLPNDEARAAWCQAKSEENRNLYIQGKEEMITKILNWKGPWYKRFNSAQREDIAVERWKGMGAAKKYLGDEQMYCRWADMYSLRALNATLHLTSIPQ